MRLDNRVIITNFGLIISNVMEERLEFLIASIIYGEIMIVITKPNVLDYHGNIIFNNI